MHSETTDNSTDDENQNPISEAEQQDIYFDATQEDVLHEAYLILYDYGYSHDDLAPLRHLITHTTIYDGYDLVQSCDRME
jgi:hypothetical protein